jgi:two-component system chemotaxis response regulator CheB
MSTAIRVVVVDGSPFMYRLLMSHRSSAPDLHIIGMVCNATRALNMVKELQPDVVMLDLDTPKLDGLQVLDCLMHECPTPVVLVSSISLDAATLTLKGVEMGAVDFILKETQQDNPEMLCGHIAAKIRAASRIRVIRSLRLRHAPSPTASSLCTSTEQPQCDDLGVAERVVVIGASTGGPNALRDLLSLLPADFPAVILVVQHIPKAFAAVLAAQLCHCTALAVQIATHGCRLTAGTALIAPGGVHLRLGPDARVQLDEGPAVGGHCPAIDITMESVAQAYGRRTMGIVLTGMGADGAKGLMAIHAAGGEAFAQDAASCVVDGMPQRARETGVVDYIGTPVQIARRLLAAPWAHRRNTA